VGLRVHRASKNSRHKERRAGRILLLFKAVVLLALVGATAYGTIYDGLYESESWLPAAAGTLSVLFVAIFVRNFFAEIPGVCWILVGLLGALVAVKGISMVWTISESLTIQELLRSSMYLAVFVLALAALSSERQVATVMDAAVLISSIVAGYGLLQKIQPAEYEVSSLDNVRVDSTLNYANTAAVVLGMGVVLALSRMAALRNPLLRGLYAALVLGFAVTLYLTVSRGGIFSLGIGVAVLLVLTGDRLQTLTNLLLVSLPGAWLLWRMRELGGLLGADASNREKISDGTTFGWYLLVAMVAAFVLQALYAFLMGRYELTPLSRRAVGAFVVGTAVLVLVVGTFLTVSRFGGVGEVYETLVSNPNNTENAGQRLASLSLGYREDYWKVAWNEWKQHPITGTGAGTFQFIWLEERTSDTGVKQVHNLYLEQGTETGIFAFLALVGFCGLLLLHTVRAAWRSGVFGERRVLLAGLAAALVVYLVSSVIEWHWYIPASTMYFFVLAAVAAKLAAQPEWLSAGIDPTSERQSQESAVG